MSEENKNLPAYPVPGFYDEASLHGLTKLEAFTMAAMQGLMSHNAAYWPTNEIAERAIKTAMATLEALEKVK